MDNYTFCEGQPATDLQQAFEGFLFNEERHLFSQSATGWNTFSLVDISSSLVMARLHVHVDEGVATSPLKAPFGSVDFSKTLSPAGLLSFLRELENRLQKKGVTKLIIKDAPQAYRLQQAEVLSQVLAELNFKISKSEINSSITVDETLWRNKISNAEQRRLRRCEAEGIHCEQIPISDLRSVYDFILACRVERGVGLSMTFEALDRTVKACINDFFLFGTFQKTKMIAACISVRVTKSVLYNFYPAHSKSLDRLSPMVFLLNHQYTFCQQNGFSLLDLGTSMHGDSINRGLLNFKTNVGGTTSQKLTFEKTW